MKSTMRCVTEMRWEDNKSETASVDATHTRGCCFRQSRAINLTREVKASNMRTRQFKWQGKSKQARWVVDKFAEKDHLMLDGHDQDTEEKRCWWEHFVKMTTETKAVETLKRRRAASCWASSYHLSCHIVNDNVIVFIITTIFLIIIIMFIVVDVDILICL